MEESPRDYALYHGLIMDCQAFSSLCEPYQDVAILAAGGDFSIDASSDHPPNLVVKPINVGCERLAFNKASVQLIADYCTPISKRMVGELQIHMTRPNEGLKVELPLLRTDPDLDVRIALSNIKKFQGSFSGEQKPPLEPVDDEAGEGIAIPESDKTAAVTLSRKAEQEKIPWDLESVQYLSRVQKSELTAEDQQEAMDNAVSHEGVSYISRCRTRCLG
jgi:hypothetical protein